MAFEYGSEINSFRDFARLGDRQYWLTPANEEEPSLSRTRGQHAELQRYHSDELKDMKPFVYDPLPSDRKRIRLLELIPGTAEGRKIYCRLIEVDYDETLHIPMKIGSNDERKRKREMETVEGDNDEVIDAELEEYSSGDEGDKEKKTKWDRFKKSKVEKWDQHKKEMEETKEQREEEAEAEFVEHWKMVLKAQIPYEALSWSWGDDTPIYAIHILKEGEEKPFKQLVRKGLALALKYLRQPHQSRTLWIDAVCINQDDIEERNHQVQMMSRIYSRATQACIWLGEDKPSTKMAFDFIREDIMNLKNFDKICSDRRYNPKWQALMELMQADWFFRRWVVQEISLSSKATVYCGPNSIPWKDFAVAVELFVEVETATHRLSEIMQNDEKFRHVPGWFEYVSELGASLLVQATGKVFRAHTKPLTDQPRENGNRTEGEVEDELRRQIQSVRTIDPLQRRSLLSLEYLVSTMFIFRATEPRDVVYSLLAVARDATPLADATLRYDDKTSFVLTLLNSFLEEKPFLVDYRRPYTDVCRDFVQFIIRRKHKLDPIQALDILCRPWALEPVKGISIRLKQEVEVTKKGIMQQRKKPWKIRQSEVIEKKGADGSVVYSIKKGKEDERCQDDRTSKEYGVQIISVTELPVFADRPEGKKWRKPAGWERFEKECNDYKKQKEEAKQRSKARKTDTKETEQDMELPSWVSRASQAPFSIYHHPGMDIHKTGRAYADPLVGQPADGHRNYSAAQTRGLNLDVLRFRKRPALGHYSLYVEGFELDEVSEVRDASQGGNIPKSWLTMAGWNEPFNTDPPDSLWRTLVADRGRDNKNPPYYYARACRESVHKGGVLSGSVNTTALINNERNSIVAEFCRRVHAVIWNRSMFKTKSGQLGLAGKVEKGDRVCILYGCSVPVVLRKFRKEPGDREREVFEDQMEALKSCIRKMVTNRERRAKNRLNKAKYLKSGEWFQMMEDRKKAEEKLRQLAVAEATEPEVESNENSTDDDFIPRPPKRCKTTYSQKKEDAQQDDPEHYYKLVGECYVHGMMDGEAMRTRFYDGEPDRSFEIR